MFVGWDSIEIRRNSPLKEMTNNNNNNNNMFTFVGLFYFVCRSICEFITMTKVKALHIQQKSINNNNNKIEETTKTKRKSLVAVATDRYQKHGNYDKINEENNAE